MPGFPQQTSTSPQQGQADGPDRARAYKSRNKRPCDFCRYKKAACHLENKPPCELCIRYNKECTFLESPAKRRRPNHDSDGSNNMAKGSHPHEPHMNGSNMPLAFESYEPMSASTAHVDNLASHRLPEHVHMPHHSIDTSPTSQIAQLPASLHLPVDATSGEPSLDNQASSNAQIVGMSGEMDPYLLSRYRFDQYNEAAFQSIRLRKVNGGSLWDGSVPAFFTIAHNALAAKAQPGEKPDVMDKYRQDVDEMVSDDVGRRLIRLFFKYVQPYFPLLTREGRQERDESGIRDLNSIPTCILAAIYGHALPFCAWDEKLCVEVYTPPSADALFRIAWQACWPCIHTPSLAVLQTILLLVQRRPTNKYVSDTPMKWVMMNTAVSVAQALGLHRDPSAWPLPAWECKVRKRLAWATFVQDKWIALNFGRSSHIQADDWDVEPLVESDFADHDRGPEASVGFWGQHFIKLCELTVIVDDIMHKMFSLKATKALHGNLEATLEVAKPLRLRLTEWHQSLPVGLLPQRSAGINSPESGRRRSLQHELDGNGCLYLAYITAKIELFRAMLRPPMTDANTAAVTALRTGALTVAGEVTEFLEHLNARELEAFWTSYARTNFTIASSFMLLLFVTSPNLPDAKECLALLSGWRSLLRIKSRSCDLLNLALLRLDGVYVAGMERLIELSPAAVQAWAESAQSK
ncbi:hypothetical protein BAUCODRAFT_66783 [Baudoinia panamericana UAMH 10762]|uniref:Zn(2)-C6 fungal-type domain-containing protein n=1 Tax=Baudoinia panamericana (strain UAMH 10762) TaxID=717646 RepID=M2NGW4_BAUPA|nr:uncharacterized protein BAUCODRAFT_66783 [Baudoinia panamericana UAMH 10762]EMC98539.1 hypothetical protein BAUCODRAFT_66783 [Baudoinia panamericana UAMH 10762]